MKETKTKLLLLTNGIPEYRIAIYNKLNDYYDLTIAHYGKKMDQTKCSFQQIILIPVKKGPFTCFKENVFHLAQQFDAVLSLAELRIFPFMFLSFHKKRNFALTYWSIGVTVSYKKKYDEDKRLDRIRTYTVGRADSLVFYSEYPIQKHLDYGIPREKMFVANNTVAVDEKIDILTPKDYFLFVGTLYKAKKIFDLLESYDLAYQKNKNLSDLIIVGDGEERENIVEWIKSKGLSDKIILKGAIFDLNQLKELFRRSIVCISPGQAGLSVLSSMGYGVPFVTTKDAITGGEMFNIADGENGLFYDGTIDGLSTLMNDLSSNPEEVYRLSKNAQEYYFENRTVSQMVEGLKDAIEYAIKNAC